MTTCGGRRDDDRRPRSAQMQAPGGQAESGGTAHRSPHLRRLDGGQPQNGASWSPMPATFGCPLICLRGCSVKPGRFGEAQNAAWGMCRLPSWLSVRYVTRRTWMVNRAWVVPVQHRAAADARRARATLTGAPIGTPATARAMSGRAPPAMYGPVPVRPNDIP